MATPTKRTTRPAQKAKTPTLRPEMPEKSEAATEKVPYLPVNYPLNQPSIVDIVKGLQYKAKIGDSTKNVLTYTSTAGSIEAAIDELGAVLLKKEPFLSKGTGVEGVINALNELIGAVNGD